VQETVDAIIKASRSDTIGDGKIFVIPLEQCIRIRTGEAGGLEPTPLVELYGYAFS